MKDVLWRVAAKEAGSQIGNTSRDCWQSRVIMEKGSNNKIFKLSVLATRALNAPPTVLTANSCEKLYI